MTENTPEPVLKAIDLSKTYYRSRGPLKKITTIKALSNINFELLPGKTLAVIGVSGSGKTTLAQQLVGAEMPTKGQILVAGTNIFMSKKTSQKQAHHDIRLIFQNANRSINPKIRVRTMLTNTLKTCSSVSSYGRNQKIEEVLDLVGLRKGILDNFPHMFSMGEKQRVAIARALIVDPKVIVADEPLAHLDMSIQAQIINLLLEIQDKLGLGYVFISNDLGVIKHIADDVLVLCSGELMEYGSVDKIFSHPVHPYTQALLASNPTLIRDKNSLMKSVVFTPPSSSEKPKGCPFSNDCILANEKCRREKPVARTAQGIIYRCHKVTEQDFND